MLKIFRQWLGCDYPDPEVGQVWKCGYNGKVFRVAAVKIGDSGAVDVLIEDWNKGWGTEYRWGLRRSYAYGYKRSHALAQWCAHLHEQRRTLLSPGEASEYEETECAPMREPLVRRK